MTGAAAPRVHPPARTDAATAGLRLLALLPWLSLALGLAAWLVYGLDMPWFDDWRGYANGEIQSLAAAYLWRPVNYTLSPVGLALDALAQRAFGGHSVAYQALSMVAVLGGLLWLQWRMLGLVLARPAERAACFVPALAMLQPGSYWGLENLAYHQALPLVFIGSAVLAIAGAERPARWRGPVVAALALLASFSYISGAFGALGAGVVLFALAWRRAPGQGRKAWLSGSAWFTAGAAIGVATQFVLSFLRFHGSADGVPLAWPWEPAFWWFALGKVGRALMLPAGSPALSLAMAAAATAGVLMVAWQVVRRAAGSGAPATVLRAAAVLLPLLAMVGVYLALVAAGRAHLRPPELAGALDIFSLAFTRFHFFWIAFVLPLVLAAALRLRAEPVAPSVLLAGAGALALFLVMAGALAHFTAQRRLALERDTVAHCLATALRDGSEIRCVNLLPPQYIDAAPDARPAYRHAMAIGASWVRDFPRMPHALRTAEPTAVARWNPQRAEGTHGIEPLGEARFRTTGADPQWLFAAPLEPMRACLTLQLDMQMQLEVSDKVQLFFAPAGEPGRYTEARSAARILEGGAPRAVSFRVSSESGFAPGLRLDPATQPQALVAGDITVSCVRPRTR